MSIPPVALVIFNRPETTKKVIDEVAKAKPSRLFVIADGPRPDVASDQERCAAARAIVEDIDWPCTVMYNYAEENLGCKTRVSSGLDWVFEHTDRAIIIEDDCIPHPSFFSYCEELLERYAHDTRIFAISGNNFQDSGWSTSYSYYFSVFSHVWGWATWRRAWRHFDGKMENWPTLRATEWLAHLLNSEAAQQHWVSIFDRQHAGEIDSWAYPWTYSCWVQHGLTILPAVNLVSNIGFGQDATHTTNSSSRLAALPVDALAFPLRHPPYMIRDYTADRRTLQKVLGIVDPKMQSLLYRITRGIWRSLPYALRNRLRSYTPGRC